MKIEQDRKVLSVVVSYIWTGKIYAVSLGLLAIGITCAFARFLPQHMISARAGSAMVQICSAACLILSVFLFAVVAGMTKKYSSGIPRETGCGMFGSGITHPQRQFGQNKVKIDRLDVVSLDKMKCLVPGGQKHDSIFDREDGFEIWDIRKELVGKGFSDNTRIFLEDRLEELVIDSLMNEDRVLEWGRIAVSLVDEIALLRTHVSPNDLSTIDHVLGCVRDKMNRLNLDLIDRDEWNPECQRAVSVVRSETAVETKILKKKACGMTFKGKVIKKQEVDVEMPFAQ